MDSAHEEFQDLCQEAKGSLDDILKIIDDYLDLSKKSLDEFEELDFRKVNDDIDNT